MTRALVFAAPSLAFVLAGCGIRPPVVVAPGGPPAFARADVCIGARATASEYDDQDDDDDAWFLDDDDDDDSSATDTDDTWSSPSDDHGADLDDGDGLDDGGD